jgi:hypothetical protein
MTTREDAICNKDRDKVVAAPPLPGPRWLSTRNKRPAHAHSSCACRDSPVLQSLTTDHSRVFKSHNQTTHVLAILLPTTRPLP